MLTIDMREFLHQKRTYIAQNRVSAKIVFSTCAEELLQKFTSYGEDIERILFRYVLMNNASQSQFLSCYPLAMMII